MSNDTTQRNITTDLLDVIRRTNNRLACIQLRKVNHGFLTGAEIEERTRLNKKLSHLQQEYQDRRREQAAETRQS
jgi:hypothetical protein